MTFIGLIHCLAIIMIGLCFEVRYFCAEEQRKADESEPDKPWWE